MRTLGAYSPLLLVPALVAVLFGGCSDDIETNPTTSTSGTGAGGTSTSTSGTGGDAGSGATSSTSGTGGDGGTGGSGGTGGTVIPNTGDDDCTGDSYNIAIGTYLQLGGDTSTATHLHTGAACSGGPTASNGPERVYELVIQDPGSLKILVERDQGGTQNLTMYFRTECANDQSTLGCFAKYPEKEGFAANIPSAMTFHMFIDGAETSSGAYIVTIEHQAPVCGDGVFNANGADGTPNTSDDEECDDGNQLDNDGCSSTCKFDVISLFDTCEGEPVVVQPSVLQILSGNTTGYVDDYIASATAGCAFAPMTGGKDRVYEVIPTQSGTLTAKVGYEADCTTGICLAYTGMHPGCWDYVLYARGPNNCAGGTQVACSDGATSETPEVISFAVQASQSYYVFVDGYAQWAGNYGTYNLCLELTP